MLPLSPSKCRSSESSAGRGSLLPFAKKLWCSTDPPLVRTMCSENWNGTAMNGRERSNSGTPTGQSRSPGSATDIRVATGTVWSLRDRHTHFLFDDMRPAGVVCPLGQHQLARLPFEESLEQADPKISPWRAGDRRRSAPAENPSRTRQCTVIRVKAMRRNFDVWTLW
jgi:hypothetical protein